MKREIKFRGKLKSNTNIWCYGHFTTDQHGKYYIVQLNADPKDKTYPFYEVESNSISEYMGLKDKNDCEIYEGDIVKPFLEDNIFAQIIFIGGCFKIATKRENGNYVIWNYFKTDIKIIGNIHDNPELCSK